MIGNELWVIYALVFGAVLLGVQSVHWVLFKERREQQAINRRLALIAEFTNPKGSLANFAQGEGHRCLDRHSFAAKLQRNWSSKAACA